MTALALSSDSALDSGERRRRFERMIAAAVLAPSAENTQPWRFRIGDEALTIALDHRRWLPSDFTGALALTGIGAAIENALIAARELGCQPRVEWLIDGPIHRESRDLDVARIELVGNSTSPDPLFPVLTTRCTTRRMERRPIDPELLQRLANSCAEFPDVRLDWVTSAGTMRSVAGLIGACNRLRFEHEPFHREFYDNLRLSRDAATSTRDGLDVDTLELGQASKSLLAYLKSWPRMRWANRVGFSYGVGRQACTEVCSSGAVGILSVGDATAATLTSGGRALERLWLATTRAGLGFHPTASLPVFLAYGAHPGSPLLPPRLQKRARDVSQRFFRIYPHLTHRTVQMAFRVGHAPAPLTRSLRRNVTDVIYS